LDRTTLLPYRSGPGRSKLFTLAPNPRRRSETSIYNRPDPRYRRSLTRQLLGSGQEIFYGEFWI